MESQHLRTICRFSAQGDKGSQDLRTVMVSFQDERTTNVKKASALEMRFPSSCASFISRNSEAHLSAATLLGRSLSLDLEAGIRLGLGTHTLKPVETVSRSHG
nr:hypothetical protein TorRG33x02_180150 [Ipomoea batatas]